MTDVIPRDAISRVVSTVRPSTPAPQSPAPAATLLPAAPGIDGELIRTDRRQGG